MQTGTGVLLGGAEGEEAVSGLDSGDGNTTLSVHESLNFICSKYEFHGI